MGGRGMNVNDCFPNALQAHHVADIQTMTIAGIEERDGEMVIHFKETPRALHTMDDVEDLSPGQQVFVSASRGRIWFW
jgi:hypothetical protein